MARTAKEIHEAAEEAIFRLVSDPKASATFDGRSYTAQDIEKLQRISEIYRAKAIERGEIVSPSEARALCNLIDVSNMGTI